jgi:hypothetical protein
LIEESGSISQMFSKDSKLFGEDCEEEVDFFFKSQSNDDPDFLDQEYLHQ